MNPLRLKKWVLPLSLLVVAVSAAILFGGYGLLRVPAGMDTMPDSQPPGTTCLIQKRPRAVTVGAVVFVDLDDGGSVLTRVAAVYEDGSFDIRHDNRASVFVHLEARGPFAVGAVRGLVLSAVDVSPQGEPSLGR